METKKEKKKISVPVLIIDIIVTVVFLFVFACLLTVMIQSMTGKEPTLFGYRSYVVITESMTGTYDKGDVIIVKVVDENDLSEDPSSIKEGDVITFIAPEGFGAVDGYTVTHRVYTAPFKAEDGKWYLITKGDAAENADQIPVPLENVTGKVLGKSEFLAGLQKVLKSKAGFLLVIVIPLVLIAVWQIAVFAAASVKSKRQKEVVGGAASETDADEQQRQEIEKIKAQAVEEYLRKQSESGKDEPQDKDKN